LSGKIDCRRTGDNSTDSDRISAVLCQWMWSHPHFECTRSGEKCTKCRESGKMSAEEVQMSAQEPAGYVQCPISGCAAIVKFGGRYIHFRNVHADLNYQEYKDKFVPAAPPEAEKPPKGAPLSKGELDATALLRDILSKHQKCLRLTCRPCPVKFR
jgi:hypothetical protein